MGMKVLFLAERFAPQPGGAARSAQRTVRILRDLGWEVHVLNAVHDLSPGVWESSSAEGVPVHRLGAYRKSAITLQILSKQVEILQDANDFALLWGHYIVHAGYLAAFYGRYFGKKSFISARGNDIERCMFLPDRLPFLLWALQRADAVGCVSRDLRRKAEALSGRTDLFHTPNSVDSNLFCPRDRDEALSKRYGLGEGPVLGFSGELRIKKGIHYMLHAFREVRAKRAAKLLIVGDIRREDRDLFRQFKGNNPHLKADMVVTGYLRDPEDLARHYGLMDLYLSPSLWEGLPNGVMEAMASGLPVVASDAGGLKELIDDGRTGFVQPRSRMDRLAVKIAEVLDVPPARLSLIRAAARKRVMEGYSPRGEREGLQKILSRLLG
jgi:glycosyltransferase involved in cell wall biosynthesis